jgi:hypothetical protein
MELLEGRFEEDSVIMVDADSNGIIFSAVPGSGPTAKTTEPEVVEAELVE